MKRKKVAMSAVVKPDTKTFPTEIEEGCASAQMKPFDYIAVAVYSLLLFLAMTVQTGRFSMILVVLALALSIGRTPLRNFRARFCIPVLGLLALALMNGLAAIYSDFGEYAVREFYKFIASVSLAVILLARFDKKHVRGLLWGFAAVCAAIAFLCIDCAYQRGIFDIFESLVGLLGADFSGIELNPWNSRVTGLYNDANVSGSICALGMLVCLYLMNTSKRWWKKLLASFCLGILSVSFFMALSRGAILCLALAMLVWLLAAGKGNRLLLFFRMFFTVLVMVLLAIPAASYTVTTQTWIPDIIALTAGFLIFALDWLLGERLTAILSAHIKLAAVLIAGLLVVCVGYGVAALSVTGPYTFDAGEMLFRKLPLSAGEYTLSGDWDGDPTAIVYLVTEENEVMGGSEKLYSGPLSDAAFTVPVTDAELMIRVDSLEGTQIRSIVFSDGTELKLGYPLLPSNVTERLQSNLLSGKSFLLRVQYVRDALKLIAKSPLIGHGLGSTEGLYTSVQPYFYESLFVHNHILQVMCDMGLLGLAGFLALLLGVAWLLLKNLRSGAGGLAAMLLACWVMVNSHSLMEINFSIRAYQCVAWFVLLLPVLLYAKPLSQKVAKWGGLVMACFIWIYLAVFGGLLESRRMVQREAAEFSTTDASEFMDTLRSYIQRDVFSREDNQLTYVANAVVLDDSRYNGYMRKYVEELRDSGTYPACSGLARYYYLPRGEFEELFECSREGIAQEASTKEAWNLQIEFYRNEVLPAAGAEHMDVFADGVLALRDYLEEYSQGRLEKIELTEENQAFLDAVFSAQEAEMPADGMYVYLTQMLGYGQEDAES